jgi:hypothetical protein
MSDHVTNTKNGYSEKLSTLRSQQMLKWEKIEYEGRYQLPWGLYGYLLEKKRSRCRSMITSATISKSLQK